MAQKSDKNLTFIEDDGYGLDELLNSDAELMEKDTFGYSYKAVIETGKVVVIRRLKHIRLSGEEFKRRIQEIVKLTRSHKNVHPLRAYYFSPEEKILLSDYMPMGTLASLLHGKGEATKATLTWKVRARIAYEVACGITHLHSHGSNICHGNITSSNILLSNNFLDARLSDFVTAQLSTNVNFINNRPSGYHAPELKTIENITKKSDVYSFGVLVLELLTGKAPTTTEGIKLASWVRSMFQEKPIVDVFDDVLRGCYYQDDFGGQMVQFLQLAICCTFQDPVRRPNMAAVVSRIKEICRFDLATTHEAFDVSVS